MTSLDDMLDKHQLYELACRYFQAVDRKQFDDLKALYHPQAIHDHGEMFSGSREAFTDWLKQSIVPLTTQHFFGNHLFEVNGDAATGELYTINYHVIPNEKGERDYVAGGRYLDEYKKEHGQWLFWRRQRLIDWTHNRETSPANFAEQLTKHNPR